MSNDIFDFGFTAVTEEELITPLALVTGTILLLRVGTVNLLNVIEVVPNVTGPALVHTNPEDAFVVPDSTKQKDPLILVFVSKSVARVSSKAAETPEAVLT